MDRRILSSLLFIQLISLLICSVGTSASIAVETKAKASMTIFTTKKDITTPITTVPTNNPIIPSTITSIFNPTVSNPDSAAAATNPMNPMMTPATTASPVSPSASWCVASQSASRAALQAALDYACGYGAADCSAIQPGGSCYNLATVNNRASYAFNSYYQKNPVPTSCNFGGTAVTTSTDPSYGTCKYASTSTSSSILNTTNSMGSRVYGAGPITPSASSAIMHAGAGFLWWPVFLLLMVKIFMDNC